MMKKSQLFLSAILLLFIISCSKSGNPNYQPVPAGKIRIGVLLSLTGSGYSTGEATQVSIELARQDIQAYLSSVGIQKIVELAVADTKTDTTEACSQLKIFYDKGIRLVLGPYSSAELQAVKKYADSHGMVIVSPSSTAVSLAIPNDNIFRFVSSDVIQGEAMNKMLTDDKIKVIIPVIRDDMWGNGLLNVLQGDFTASGGSVQPAVKYSPGTTDFTALLSLLDAGVAGELNHHNPNEVAVYMLSFSEGAAILGLAKNYPNLNNVYWYGGSAFAENTALQANTGAALFAYTHGLPCPVYGLDDGAKYKWQPLTERITAQLGRQPEVYALTAYDALWVCVLTYAQTGHTPATALLKSALVNVAENFYGVTGETRLDDNGDRAVGNYDFWAVKHDTTGYNWKRVAKYNSQSGTLVRE